MPRTIFALGGRGFSSLEPTPALDSFFTGLAKKSYPTVGLIPTAGGDQAARCETFEMLGTMRGFRPRVISLFRRDEMTLEEEVASCDCIFVGGGNTWNMLHLWRLWGLDLLLRQAYERGVPLGGVSAGANCWFEQCSTDSFGPGLAVMEGLGWLSGSYCPHYDGEENRRPTLESFLRGGSLKPGYACDDGVGLLFEDETLKAVYRCPDAGAAYRVSWNEGAFRQEPIEPLITV
jgi:dipeptidase E